MMTVQDKIALMIGTLMIERENLTHRLAEQEAEISALREASDAR